MYFDQFLKLITIAGKGLVIGFGIGAVIFGLFFLSLSIKNGQELNIGAMLAIFGGLFCVVMGLIAPKKKD